MRRRDFLAALSTAALCAALPASAQDPMSLVDPDLRPALEGFLGHSPFAAIRSDMSPAQLAALRATLGRLDHKPLPRPPVTQRRVGDVPLYVINAKPGTRRPAILHMHGGGYILGTAASSVPDLQPLAEKLDCLIVTVDYRLAPETRFPGSLEDNYAALKWLHASADELGADPARIAVAGESAGGGHAAMLAIAARDRGEVPIVHQSLTYPMLDDRTGSTRVLPPHIGTYLWTAEDNRVGWTALLGVPAGSANPPEGAVPSRVDSLKGLAPAWIGVGAIDLFVDEDIDYARRLVNAGVATELLVVPGAYHAFDFLAPRAAASMAFRQSREAALARAFSA